MIKIPFADMAEIVNSLPSAELAFKTYIRSDRFVPHKQIMITYTPRVSINEMMRKYKSIDLAVGTMHDLNFEAYPVSYKTFCWKLLTPVIVEG